MKKSKAVIGIAVVLLIIAVTYTYWIVSADKEPEFIILSTTTSTQDSGLLDYLLPSFEEASGIEVRVVAVGTGAALQMGRDGEADVLLVHSKADEIIFIEEGHGLERFDVMYNDFVLVGPTGSEASLAVKQAGETAAAFQSIADNGYTFVSRGDDSGTHKKELKLWTNEPTGDWYVSAGKGMGDVLQMANELQGFTLTDRATYLSMQASLDLEIVLEGDPALLNYYGVIAVDPDKNARINAEGADAFVKWMLSDETQTLIGAYGMETYGEPLFFPNAK
ncbi:MAG TPA: substrate-binding domain-containing protein [Fusibacter sp.]|nr:substrate-binding domain-containing protein [Fusibacter sp.]